MYIMPRSHRHSANISVRIHLCVWVCCFHICVCMQSSSLYERITNYIKNVYHICTDISLYSYSTESAIYRAMRVKETERCDWNSKIQVSMCVRFPLCYFFFFVSALCHFTLRHHSPGQNWNSSLFIQMQQNIFWLNENPDVRIHWKEIIKVLRDKWTIRNGIFYVSN